MKQPIMQFSLHLVFKHLNPMPFPYCTMSSLDSYMPQIKLQCSIYLSL